MGPQGYFPGDNQDGEFDLIAQTPAIANTYLISGASAVPEGSSSGCVSTR